jgi:hypothetical protein
LLTDKLVGSVVLPDRKQAPREGSMAWTVSLSLERLLSVSVLELELELELEFVVMLVLDGRLLVLFSRLRPGRLVKKYWHVMPRLSHLEHDGFSLGHLTLDMAQA